MITILILKKNRLTRVNLKIHQLPHDYRTVVEFPFVKPEFLRSRSTTGNFLAKSILQVHFLFSIN